jgi:hypothetical protein
MQQTVEKTSTPELMAAAERLSGQIASMTGQLVEITGELDRREGWRTEGATSVGAWAAQRLGISERTGRQMSEVAKRLWDLPHLSKELRDGALTFDKVRVVSGMATPETDARLSQQAKELSVRQLSDMARSVTPKSDQDAADDYEGRYLRFNDARRTIMARLPETDYALAKAALVDYAKNVIKGAPDVTFEQRLCDSFVALCQSGAAGGGRARPYFVVAHTALSLLRGGAGAADLEGLGNISAETIRRIACDATIALAIDDDLGHTMYEGRAERLATDAQRREATRRDRHCRFPGCSNSMFTNVHHIIPWDPNGLTDLPNLVTLCVHHHHRVHEGGWHMSGNANDVLTFVGPSGHVMKSQPSPLWTKGPNSGRARK